MDNSPLNRNRQPQINSSPERNQTTESVSNTPTDSILPNQTQAPTLVEQALITNPVSIDPVSTAAPSSQHSSKKLFIIMAISLVVITAIVAGVLLFIRPEQSGDTANLPGSQLATPSADFDRIARARCDDSVYQVLYTGRNNPDQAVIVCNNHHKDVYYLNALNKLCGVGYNCNRSYNFGHTFDETVEEFFPDGKYFFHKPMWSGIPDSFRIVLQADSEADLLSKYSDQLYGLIKKWNEEYNYELEFLVFYNDTLEGVNTVGDQLLMLATYTYYDRGMGDGKGDYVFNDEDPEGLLSEIFSDRSNYPDSLRTALKFNRRLDVYIKNGRSITQNEFEQLLVFADALN